jgi:hypothetical protein
MTLIQAVVYLILIGAALYVVTLLPIDATVKTIIRVIVIVVVCLWLLTASGILHSGPVLWRNSR